jgi:hypothetical protein
VEAKSSRGALSLGRDSLETVVVSEVVDPPGPGGEVADEVEDLLPRGVDRCGE